MFSFFFIKLEGVFGCPFTFDNVMCWNATAPNTTISQHCIDLSIFDTTSKIENAIHCYLISNFNSKISEIVTKYCTPEGRWEGPYDKNNVSGYTNYTPCYNQQAMDYETLNHLEVISLYLNKRI
jgi:hypothetical protein